jgi:hypothetical protein
MEVSKVLLSTSDQMNSSEYKVSLGSIARTLLYEDSQGIIRFGFDFDTSEGKNILILERPVSGLKRIDSIEDEQLRVAEQARISMAFERTKKYLLEQGHQVKVWPDEFK